MEETPIYVVWETTTRGGFASVTELRNVPSEQQLAVGVPRADGFPSDAEFQMNPSHPRDKKLAHAIKTASGNAIPLVSETLADFIRRYEPRGVEFLPVRILNHSGKIASADYFIMNPTTVVDCLDEERMTSITRSRFNKSSIISCDKIVLNDEAIATAPPLFRIQNLENVVLIRQDIISEAKERFTGLYWRELSRYTV